MVAHVGRLRHHFEIAGTVVEFVSVAVVYPFITMQWPSQGICRYEAVLENVIPIDSHHPISESGKDSSAPPMSGTLTTGVIRTGAGAIETARPPAKLPLLPSELLATATAHQHAIGASNSLHRGPLYYFDEEEQQIRHMFETVL